LDIHQRLESLVFDVDVWRRMVGHMRTMIPKNMDMTGMGFPGGTRQDYGACRVWQQHAAFPPGKLSNEYRRKRDFHRTGLRFEFNA
jgi:hypothetical protein